MRLGKYEVPVADVYACVSFVCLVQKTLAYPPSASLTDGASFNSKMAEHAADLLADILFAQKGADNSLQEEAEKTNASGSSNVAEVPPQESQAPPGEEKKDELEEGLREPEQVLKRPASKGGNRQKKMTISEVKSGMDSKSSKLAEEMSVLKKRKAELRKQRQEEAKRLKQAERKVKRLKDKAHLLSNNDLMEVFLLRKEVEEQNAAKAAASSNQEALCDE